MNLQICATDILMQADRGVESEAQRAFRRTVEANGLTSRTPEAAQLRHCFAPYPLQAVCDMPTVERLLGHASPTTTTPTKGRILGAEHELPKATVVYLPQATHARRLGQLTSLHAFGHGHGKLMAEAKRNPWRS